MKNLEWLKEEVDDYLDIEGVEDARMALKAVLGYIDQLDEPETLSQEWIDNHTAGADTIAHYSEEDVPVVTVSDLEKLLVPKLDLPVIPDYVAEYIEIAKNRGDTLAQGYNISTYYKEGEWLLEKENCELFARAWLDGYTVEEKKYQIHFGNHKYAQRFNDKWLSSQITDKEFASTFTKEEIKKLENSDLYWDNFAEEVTE